MRPRVSVVMTHYNQPELALEGIQSLLDQTLPAWELLFFDDGSTRKPELPDDPRIVPHWLPDLPLELRKAKARYAVLNNRGLQAARGEFVTYLTHDGLYFPDRLQRMVQYLDEHPTVNACYGPQVLRYRDEDRWVDRGLRTGPTIVIDPWHLLDHDQVMHRASVGRLTQGWPEDRRFWRDADGHFFRRLIQVGGPIRRIPGHAPTDVHRFIENSVTDLLDKNQLDQIVAVEPAGAA